MAWLRCEHTIEGTERIVPLRKIITTIGRSKQNELALEDAMLEHSHITIVKAKSGYEVALAGKSGELYLQGKKVKSGPLKDGYTILIGAWRITFTTAKPEEHLKEKEAHVSVEMVQNLVSLSKNMLNDGEPEVLFEKLLEGIVRLTRAEKGFVIVFQDGDRHVAAAHNVDNEILDIRRVSDSIVTEVVNHLKPIIVSDALRDSRFGKAQSVVDLRLSSVMCVPLIYRSDLLGVIYLGNDSVTDLFTKTDLDLLTVYAAQASLMVFHAHMLNRLRLDNRKLRSELQQTRDTGIIGGCEQLRAIFKVTRRVAPTDLSVLVLGATGTGKELVAKDLHRLSSRKDGPFIALNCGAIPEHLLESELFGHRKGAFTGAIADKLGKIEAADGGTLFLDEIAEMPMNLQVKLLRVLQERRIERVGDIKPRDVDIRVVSATNKDLSARIESGAFRDDLFFRLNEMSIELPLLKDRGEDITLLAMYFLNLYKGQYSAHASGFTNQALLAMKHHPWPGNVRELESRIKKAIIMTDRALINPDDLGLSGGQKREIQSLSEAQETFTVNYIRQVLELNNWNKAQTARDLNIDARTVFRYIEKFQLD